MGKIVECAKVDPSSDCEHVVRGESLSDFTERVDWEV